MRLSWITGDTRNLLLELKSKLGHNHAVLSTPKTSPGKNTLTVAEQELLAHIEKTDSPEELFA